MMKKLPFAGAFLFTAPWKAGELSQLFRLRLRGLDGNIRRAE
jgi:hypothetical protein